MSDFEPKRLYAETQIVELLQERIHSMRAHKSQRQIAYEIGYDNPNVLSMYKHGYAKVPLERIPAIARVLEIDLALLFRLGMEQWWPGLSKELSEMFAERIITDNERDWLGAIREAYGEVDPKPTPERIQRLREK